MTPADFDPRPYTGKTGRTYTRDEAQGVKAYIEQYQPGLQSEAWRLTAETALLSFLLNGLGAPALGVQSFLAKVAVGQVTSRITGTSRLGDIPGLLRENAKILRWIGNQMSKFLNATLTFPSAKITLDFLNRRQLYEGPNVTELTDHYVIAIWGGKERARQQVSQAWYDHVQPSLGPGSTTTVYPGGSEAPPTQVCSYGSQSGPC